MEIKTKAIVIGAQDKGESDKKVKFFSVDQGIFEATVRGVKKQGAKLTSCTFSFAFVEIVLAEKNGFFTVTSSEMIEPFFDLSLNLEKYGLASLALEIVSEIARSDQNNAVVFVELLKLFYLLCNEDDAGLKLVWCKWAWDMLAIAGFLLNLSKCSVCGKSACGAEKLFVDMESGSVTCDVHRPEKGIVSDISSGVFAVLSGFDRVELEDMKGRRIKNENVTSDEVFEFLKNLFQGILGKKFKSILF